MKDCASDSGVDGVLDLTLESYLNGVYVCAIIVGRAGLLVFAYLMHTYHLPH